MTGGCSTASFACCGQVHHGVICLTTLAPTRLAKIASFAGAERAWDRVMNSLSLAHDAGVQMIDTSIVRVHQHGACITRNTRQSIGRSRGGLTSKIHAVVDTNELRYGSRRLLVKPTTIGPHPGFYLA